MVDARCTRRPAAAADCELQEHCARTLRIGGEYVAEFELELRISKMPVEVEPGLIYDP